MKKWKLILILVTCLIIGILLFHDARTLDIDRSDLPVNEQLAITISQRYLAGYWTHSVKLHLEPYEMKNVKETSETFVVDIIDERDIAFCKGYQVVEKDTGNVIGKEDVNYCN